MVDFAMELELLGREYRKSWKMYGNGHILSDPGVSVTVLSCFSDAQSSDELVDLSTVHQGQRVDQPDSGLEIFQGMLGRPSFTADKRCSIVGTARISLCFESKPSS